MRCDTRNTRLGDRFGEPPRCGVGPLQVPAVVTVKEGLNLPRYPSVPGRLRAKRKPVDSRTPNRPEPRLEMLRLKLPPGSGKQVEVLGRGPDAAPAVVGVLQALGLV